MFALPVGDITDARGYRLRYIVDVVLVIRIFEIRLT